MVNRNRFMRTFPSRLERPAAAPTATTARKSTPPTAAATKSRAARAAWGRRHRRAGNRRQIRDAAREMTDVEIQHAGSDVPLRRLRVNPLEGPRELCLDSKRHRKRQVFIEQLRTPDDDALHDIRHDPAQKLRAPAIVLERPRAPLATRRHYLREAQQDEQPDY